MSQWVFYTMLSMVLYGVWAFVGKLATNYVNSQSVLLFQVIGGVLVSFAVLAHTGFKLQITNLGVVYGLLFGIMGTAATFLFVKALAEADAKAGVVTIINALYPGVTLMLSMIFLGEHITLKQGLGIVMAAGAIFLLVS